MEVVEVEHRRTDGAFEEVVHEIGNLKFDIERSCIYSLFTTFRERIYTKTLLGLEESHHKKRGHPCKECEEREVHLLVHVKGFKLLIISGFD